MNFPIIKKRKIWYTFSAIAVVIAVVSLIVWGLRLSIDFTGGTLLEVSFAEQRPSVVAVTDSLSTLELGEVSAQPAGNDSMIVRFRTVTEEEHQAVLEALRSSLASENPEAVIEQRFEAVGPSIGQELARKALWALVVAIIFIIAYIAYAFRKVSKPVESWKFGITAIIALVHDVVIITGIFALLGQFAGVEVGAMFVTALLTILGFSVHDTIVVFDRTRENLLHNREKDDFEVVVEKAVNQTIWRSINTSLSTLFVLGAIYFFGGESIKYFTLALILGILIGTYSSIFIASPVIVDWYKLGDKKK